MKKTIYLGVTVSVLLVLIGLGFLIYPKITDLYYMAAQKRLEGMKGQAWAENNQNDEYNLPNGTVGKIVISKIGLEAYVLEGTDKGTLNKGPGHYEETPLPGEDGNSAIAGHRTMYGHPFRRLDKLINGDEIIIYSPTGKHIYKVAEKKVVSPKDLSVIGQGTEAELTLTTCNPVGSARQRLVITALLIQR